jgi:hypothetical protein
MSNSQNSYLWSSDSPHGTVEKAFQHELSVNVWCSLIRDQLIGSFVLEQHLTADNYLNFLMNELLLLMGDMPLETRYWILFFSMMGYLHISVVKLQLA